MLDDKDPDTYMYDVWLVFKEAQGYWLNRILKKGFGHVLMVVKDKYNWMYFDPHQLRLTYGIAPYTADEDLPRLLKEDGYTVLRVTFIDRDTHKKLRYSHLCTCVSFVKYAMGISVRCLTPYGLYKKLQTMSDKNRAKNGIIAIRKVI